MNLSKYATDAEKQKQEEETRKGHSKDSRKSDGRPHSICVSSTDIPSDDESAILVEMVPTSVSFDLSPRCHYLND